MAEKAEGNVMPGITRKEKAELEILTEKRGFKQMESDVLVVRGG